MRTTEEIEFTETRMREVWACDNCGKKWPADERHLGRDGGVEPAFRIGLAGVTSILDICSGECLTAYAAILTGPKVPA